MTLEDVMEKLEAIERKLALLIQPKTYFTITEAAEFLKKTEYTVREYCKQGELHAVKANVSSGMHQQWRIAYDELLRFLREGKRQSRITSEVCRH
jgi:excisionase family DNA binding protein